MAQSTEVTRLLKLFDDAQRTRQDKKDTVFKELDAFDRGDQWNIKNTAYPPWIPRPVTNYVHYVRTYKTASISVESLIGKLRPITPEDVEDVGKLQTVYEYLWDYLQLKHKIRDTISDSRLFGTGILQIGWDESKLVGGKNYRAEGEITATLIPPVNFYPDPTAFDLESCRYIVIAERKTKNWLMTQPQFKEKATKIQELTSKDSAYKGEVLYRDYTTNQTAALDFYSFYEKVPNKDGGFGIKVTYIANGEILHIIEDLKPACYPFLVLREWKQTHDFWGKSSCETILDNQKLINKIESIIATIGTLLSNPIKIVHQGSGIDPKIVSKYGSASGYTFQSKIDVQKAIHFVDPPQIPPSLFRLLEETKGAIKEIAGLNDAYVGNAIGSVQTSAGVNSLIDRSTIRDKDAMYELELFITDLTSLLIKFMTTHYDTKRMLRIENKDPNSEEDFTFVEFIGKEFAEIEFDFLVDVTTKTEHSKQKEAQDMKDLLQMQMQFQPAIPLVTVEEAIQMSDISALNKDVILKRMREQESSNQLDKMKQVIQFAIGAINAPDAQEKGLNIDQIAEAGVQIMQPTDTKLGSVGDNQNGVQSRQAGM